MVCSNCEVRNRERANFCRDCGARLGQNPSTGSTNLGYGDNAWREGAINFKDAVESWSMEKKLLAIASVAVLFIFLLVGFSLGGSTGGNRVDEVRACNFFTDGYKVAMSENGSAYGMQVWRDAAREGAKYADGQLAFELNRFARGGPSSTDAQLNINEMCF